MTQARTAEEIQDLKNQWIHDGCWDIEETEGFEAHRDELKSWRANYEAEQEKRELTALKARAQKNNLTLEEQELLEACEANRELFTECAVKTLTRCLKVKDREDEIASAIEDIVRAAVSAVKADLIKKGAPSRKDSH